MRVILDVLQGPRKGRTFVFDRHDMFIVGRSRFVHCPMPEDSALSRDHFLIEINPPRCDLRDLGSTNGTFVNERRVDRVRLNSGDRIAAGQSIFQVRVEGSYVALKEAGRAAGKRSEGRTETMHDRSQRDGDPLCRLRLGGAARRRCGQHGRRGDGRGGRVALRVLPLRGRGAPAAGAALHHAPRAGPGGDGDRLPGAAQPDRGSSSR